MPTPNIYSELSLSSYGNHLPNECRFKMTKDSRFEIFSDQSLIPLGLISENYLFEMTVGAFVLKWQTGLSFRNDSFGPSFRNDSHRLFFDSSLINDSPNCRFEMTDLPFILIWRRRILDSIWRMIFASIWQGPSLRYDDTLYSKWGIPHPLAYDRKDSRLPS